MEDQEYLASGPLYGDPVNLHTCAAKRFEEPPRHSDQEEKISV